MRPLQRRTTNLSTSVGRRFVLTAAAAALAQLFASWRASAQSVQTEQDTLKRRSETAGLLAALRRGGFVIFLRHANTSGMPRDSRFEVGRRDGQRNLSPVGRTQATAIGEAMRVLRIPVGKVMAGPVFRARDTAELAFGSPNVEITDALLADDYAGGRLKEVLEAARRLLGTRPEVGNTVLVGHRTPLELLTGLAFPDSVLPEGGLAIFVPLGEDGFRYAGNLTLTATSSTC